MPCWEMIASGRVQGVGFRWFAKHCAERYKIKGHVRNLSDGTVCIIACGEGDELALYAEELRQGNRHAQVGQLTISEVTHYTEYEEFVIA